MSIGDIGIFSFYGNKTITTGEGGMLVTDRADLAEKAHMLRDHGMPPYATGQSLPVAEDLARRVKEEDTPPLAFKPLLIQHPWCTQGYVVWIGLLSLALPGFG